MKSLTIAGKVLLVVSTLLPLWACSTFSKPEPLVPLPLGPEVPEVVGVWTRQGTEEYQQGRYADAKAHFERAVTTAPASGEAHYNLGLALHALGESDAAKKHFLEAASLAPGNRVIWDSPALRPYGAPESSLKKEEELAPPSRGGLMGGLGGPGN